MDKKTFTGFLKRQTFVIISCLIVVISGVTAVSSAIYLKNIESNKNQIVKSGTFVINFQNGTTISDDVLVLIDEKGLETKSYDFSVTNTGSLEASYAILLGRQEAGSNYIDNQYIKYSIDGEAPRTLTNSSVYSGTDDSNKLYTIKMVNKKGGTSTPNQHHLRVWIDSLAPDNVISKKCKLSIQVVALVADPSNELGYQFEYTGKEETYTVPYTGTYVITAAGAQGAVGNKFQLIVATTVEGKIATTSDGQIATSAEGKLVPYRGGKGAKIAGEFDLQKGDKLHFIVGGQGNTTTGTQKDGAGGAGGGGSFVFKEISSLNNNKYQFSKNNINFETLLVAAGGSGTGDMSFNATYKQNGKDGDGVNYKSLSNYTAFSTTVSTSTVDSVMGISQYITHGLVGGSYTREKSICRGGFGGGGCQDDKYGWGGGWSGANYVTYSWSIGANTSGVNGAQEGNGYINIKLKS